MTVYRQPRAGGGEPIRFLSSTQAASSDSGPTSHNRIVTVTAGAPAKSSRTPLLIIGGLLLVALAIGGILQLAQGDSGDSDTLPAQDELPSNVVAVVAETPDSIATVTTAEFEHALKVAAAAADQKSTPEPGDEQYPELRDTALGELLDAIWIAKQAKEMGISVSAADVSDELEKLKKQNFKTADEYQDFLEESHYTPADVDRRVEIQLLSTAVQERIKNRAGASQRAQEEEFTDFVKDYSAKWRSRTVCAAGFVDGERCSNGKKPQNQEGDSGADGVVPGAPPG